MKSVGTMGSVENVGAQYPINFSQIKHANVMEESKVKENTWKTKEKDLGIVIPGTQYKVEFTYLGDKDIQMVITQCGCTQATIQGNKVSTVYTPKPKPAHITGPKQESKSVTVKFKDGTSEKVYLKGVIE